MVMRKQTNKTSQCVEWEATTTTIMMRNIPNQYGARELLNELWRRGFGRCLDFFYLPIDFTTKKNKGYAFINLIDAESARQFRADFDKNLMTVYRSRPVEVSASVTQGFVANVEWYLRRRVRPLNPWARPLLIKQIGRNLICHPLCTGDRALGDKIDEHALKCQIGCRECDLYLPVGPANGPDKTPTEEQDGGFISDDDLLCAMYKHAVKEICYPES